MIDIMRYKNSWKHIAGSLLLAGCLLLGFAGLSSAATYQCVQDTYIDTAYPKDNFGGSDRLLISNSGNPTRVLMKFNIPEWADSSNIKQATLIIYSAPWTGGAGGTTDFDVYALTRSWTEGSCVRYNDPTPDDGATWNQYNFDADSSKNQWASPGGDYDESMHADGTFPAGNDWGPFSIDVTELLENRLNNLRDYGFLVRHPREDAAGGWQNFASSDSTGYDPPRYTQLEIDFIEPPPNTPPDAPSNPAPGNNDTGVLLTPTLSWSGGDPDPDNTVTYDVYFGLKGALTLVSSGQVAVTYLPGALQLAATYEWKVVARDNYGAETSGPLWSFSTIKSGIASVSPSSGSPFYFQDKSYIPRPVLINIKGAGTAFRFSRSQVSFNDEGIKVLFCLPVSPAELWALVIIEETARPGLHDVTVNTAEEAAVGSALFEVKKYWRGTEQITVKHNSDAAAVALRGLPVHLFKEKESLCFSEIIEKAAIPAHPENYFYNLISNDNYSLERGILLGGWPTGLPTWADMQKGYLYLTKSSGLLAGWSPDTVPGRIGNCYNAKFMEGGFIEVREKDIID
ncbi:MAG: DNRLRE domain-containing protein [Proteobacteria bacterium]|nr:DNRLRE domain-containing protein [Pseudomonadota bacterium]